jgi:hypothetical protein
MRPVDTLIKGASRHILFSLWCSLLDELDRISFINWSTRALVRDVGLFPRHGEA